MYPLRDNSYRPTALIESVQWLHGIGLNVFPLPYGEKIPRIKPKQWGIYNTPLNYADLPYIFQQKSNVAVVTGRTSRNLFVIDCDDLTTFHQHLAQLSARSIPIFAALTARGGHIYLRATRSIGTHKLLNADLKGGDEGYVVAPPSIHPTGALYHWIDTPTIEPPLIDLAQIDWLKAPNGEPFTIANTTTYAAPTLRFIRNGEQIGNRNNALYMAAKDMAYRGESPQTIERTLIPSAIATGLDSAEITATIQSGIRNGSKRTKPTNADALYAYSQNHQWRGRTGTTDRAVFEALIERSKRDYAHSTFRASCREIAELANLTPKTALRSIGRLLATGLINKTGRTELGASVYSFNAEIIVVGEQFLHNDYSNSVAVKLYTTVVITQKNYLSLSAALGQTAARIINHLNGAAPHTAQQIATALNLSINQTYTALRKLREQGIVSKDLTYYRLLKIPYHHIEQGSHQRDQRRQQHIYQRQTRAAARIIKTQRN